MTRSEFYPHRQRCSANCIFMPSLRGNVVMLMYDTGKVSIFAA